MRRMAKEPISPLREKLRAAIAASGLSIAQLAALCQIPRSTLHRQIASGELWLDTFCRICSSLRIDPATLLEANDAATVTDARRLADLLAPLATAERHALRALVETAVQLRTAAVAADRLHAGQADSAGRKRRRGD